MVEYRASKGIENAAVGTALGTMFGREDAELAEGLTYWQPDQCALINAYFQRDNPEHVMRTLLRTLRSHRVPEEGIPLMREEDRFPFRDLDDDAIRLAVRNVLAYPEKDGLMSGIIRAYLGVEYKEPKEFFRVEAHFDSKPRVTRETQRRLVALGFEPDNFHEFVPRDYNDHCTLRFNVPASQKKRYDQLRKIAGEKTSALKTLIGVTSNADGYIEVELYKKTDPDTHIAVYPYRPTTQEAVNQFPFEGGSLTVLEVPTTATEAERANIPLDARKSADIHIEIPSQARGKHYPDAESLPMNALRSKLIGMGFYQVQDVWGDTIYTAQFRHMDEALCVYRRLQEYFERSGGPTQMYLEPCSEVWRNTREVGGELVYANVPPLVEFRLHAQKNVMQLRERHRSLKENCLDDVDVVHEWKSLAQGCHVKDVKSLSGSNVSRDT